MKKPSENLEDLLTGRVAPKDANQGIMKWAEFHIYTAAVEVLELPKDERRSAIDRMPETLRPYLEREIKKLWTLRRE